MTEIRRRATSAFGGTRTGLSPRPIVTTPHTFDVRCRFCMRLIGRAVTEKAKGIMCTNPLCTIHPAVGEYENRDRAMLLLWHAGWLPQDIGDVFGVTRQRVVQILQI